MKKLFAHVDSFALPGMLCLLAVGTLQIASAQTNYQKLKSFGTAELSGIEPRGALTEAGDGMLYGTTYRGGSNNMGTVFRLSKEGSNATVLHNFTGGSNGAFSSRTLLKGSDGMFYGTTDAGGSGNLGVLFKMNTNGSGFTVFHTFTNFLYGGVPQRLLEGTGGTLYGTTKVGGSNGVGTVFKINTNGTGHGILHSFNGTNGESPNDLLLGQDGILYGTTFHGGSNSLGTVFKLNTNGSGFLSLRIFAGGSSDGSTPTAGLAEGDDGLLYGTTYEGGISNKGIVFKLNKNGSNFVILRSFTGVNGDGANPQGGIIETGSGALYGTTYLGGSNNVGTVFKLNKNGSNYSVLYSFKNTGGDGNDPWADLVEGSDGAVYGTTFSGGNLDFGTVFRLSSPIIQLSRLPGNLLRLSWPSSFTGWRLQSQTNAPGLGLKTNWGIVAGSTATNVVTLPISPSVGSVFLRLAAP